VHTGVKNRRSPEEVRDHSSSRGTGGVRSTTLEWKHFRSFVDKEKAKSLNRRRAEVDPDHWSPGGTCQQIKDFG
jgi:hypothetical protein